MGIYGWISLVSGTNIINITQLGGMFGMPRRYIHMYWCDYIKQWAATSGRKGPGSKKQVGAYWHRKCSVSHVVP